jgi:hypothetical protein
MHKCGQKYVLLLSDICRKGKGGRGRLLLTDEITTLHGTMKNVVMPRFEKRSTLGPDTLYLRPLLFVQLRQGE